MLKYVLAWEESLHPTLARKERQTDWFSVPLGHVGLGECKWAIPTPATFAYELSSYHASTIVYTLHG